MKNATFLLLTSLCLLSFGTGCVRDGKKDEPDSGTTETNIRDSKETKQESSSEDAETVARQFVDAMNRFLQQISIPCANSGRKDSFRNPSGLFWSVPSKAEEKGTFPLRWHFRSTETPPRKTELSSKFS